MRLQALSIEGFRGLTFTHDFKNDNFIVITGVNGSGKSTIIEVVDLLLSRSINQINEQFANQITAEHATFEISVMAETGEVDYLAEKMQSSQPNSADKETIAQELTNNIFIDGIYRRKIVIQRPTLGWAQNNPSHIQEYINDKQVNISTNGIDSVISPQHFNVMSRQLLLKFEQLENINLQMTQRNPVNFSIQDIFSSANDNFAQRQIRTNLSASPLLDSLIKYGSADDTELRDLIQEFELILDPLKLKIMHQSGGFSHLALTRDGNHSYTVDSASSGQKKAIVLATLKYVWERTALKPIVLLDEPENSMHPDLTTRIFQSLNELASAEPEPSIIIATHSAEVVASNSHHVFRITTNKGMSGLAKIKGLEERASIMEELGIKFNLDYVAQRVVFVEGTENGASQGIGDAEAYQTRIDPLKEKVLFVDCGSKSSATSRYALQRQLMDRLKQSSTIFDVMTDRDEVENEDEHSVPFWDVEYLYLANIDLLVECANTVLQSELDAEEVRRLIPSGSILENVKTKNIWVQFIRNYSIKNAQVRNIQKIVLKRLREDDDLRTEAITELMARY